MNRGLQTLMSCNAILFTNLNLANFCHYQFAVFRVLIYCSKQQSFNIHRILEISLLFCGVINGVILTQASEVSVNSKSNKIVWQIVE